MTKEHKFITNYILPRDFDARAKWPRFITKPSLTDQGEDEINSNLQGTCEAEPSIAFSVLTSVTADRFAIHMNSKIGVDIGSVGKVMTRILDFN